MLDVRDLQIVRAIAEHGSLVRAARVLNTSQPSLTRNLAAIEAGLRGPLFDRSGRGVVPTDLCRVVLAASAEILDRIEQLNRQVTEVRGGQTQDLVITAGPYASETICIVAAGRMLEPHPTVRVRLSSMNWAEVPRAIREREASIGVMDMRELGEEPDLLIEPLRPQPGIFAVRPGHPLLDVKGLELTDILAWPLAFVGRVPRRVQEPMALAREAARLKGRLHPAFPALIHESPTVQLTALRHSNAVAAITVAIAATALEAGHVVALPWRAPWVSVHYAIIQLRGRRRSEAVDAYLDLLRSADLEAEALAHATLRRLGLPMDVE